jgi:hypothetical protein
MTKVEKQTQFAAGREPACDCDTANFPVVLIGTEFSGIQTRSPGIRGRSVRGTAAPIFVKLEGCTNDGVTFFLINQFYCFFFSCHFAYFVG